MRALRAAAGKLGAVLGVGVVVIVVGTAAAAQMDEPPAPTPARLDPPTVGEALTPGQQQATEKLDKAIAKDRGKVEDALQRIGGCATVHEDEVLTVALSDRCLAKADEEVQEAVGVDVLSNGMAP
jgi:hypothetical protein